MSVILFSQIINFKNILDHFKYEISFSISFCSFSRSIHYNGNDRPFYFSNGGFGGIIYCYNVPSKMKIEDCFFFECFCTGMGGAIFFDCQQNGSGSNLKRICCNNCFTDSNYYQFALVLVPNSIDSTNICDFVTISKCNNISNGFYSFHLYHGNISLKNCNSSNNLNKEYSGLALTSPFLCIGMFCSIMNNNVTSYRNLMLHSNNNNFFSFFNIIQNNSPENYGVITNWAGSYFFNNSFFLDNYDFLFYLKMGNLNISNSYIFHDNFKIGNIVLLENIKFEKINTIYILYFNSFLCEKKKGINLSQIKHNRIFSMVFICKLFLSII